MLQLLIELSGHRMPKGVTFLVKRLSPPAYLQNGEEKEEAGRAARVFGLIEEVV